MARNVRDRTEPTHALRAALEGFRRFQEGRAKHQAAYLSNCRAAREAAQVKDVCARVSQSVTARKESRA